MNRQARRNAARQARAGHGQDAAARLLRQGVAHHQQGDLKRATDSYRSALAKRPGHPDALHLLGVAYLQSGDAGAAIETLNEAVGIAPRHIPAHTNLGLALRAAGRIDDAVAAFRAALALDPSSVDAAANLADLLVEAEDADSSVEVARAYADRPDAKAQDSVFLGSILLRAGRAREAADVLEPLTRVLSGDAELWLFLGDAYDSLDRHADAVEAYRRATDIAPDFVEAWANLGAALRHLGRDAEAMSAYRRAADLVPDLAEARMEEAGCAWRAGDLATAARAYEQVVAQDPERLEAAHGLGVVELGLGRLDAARARFATILERDPNHAPALHEFVALGGADDDPEGWLARLADALGATTEDAEHAAALHYAAGRLCDRLGRHFEAFDHWRAANESRAAAHPFDPVHAARVDRLVAANVPGLFEAWAEAGDPSDAPVFVVGLPRSGTTLVEQILASHPHVHGAGERPELGRMIVDLPVTLGVDASYPECLGHMTADCARNLAASYLASVAPEDGTARRIVDKMPSNFLRLGFAALLFPNARVVHCVRDPLDTALSCFMQNFSKPQPFSYRLEWIAEYYLGYRRLMEHWQAVLPLPIHDVIYEDLTANLEAGARALIDFCGLDWDDRCLAFHETERPVRTASALQVRRPVYRTSVGRWRRYAEELEPLRARLAEEGLLS